MSFKDLSLVGFRSIQTAYVCLFLGVPTLGAIAILRCDTLPNVLRAIASPIVFVLLYLVSCGALSYPFHNSIKNGRFKRSLEEPLYRRRSLFGLCWCAVYYSPFYWIYLSIPLLRRTMLTLFGYRGSLTLTIYPDTWIRDLPILKIAEGAYISNKATLGTNLVLRDGRILVRAIAIGRRAMIGHLVMLAAGTSIGDDAEIGHGTACGSRVDVGESVVIGPVCVINHRAQIGDRTVIGARSYVGFGAIVAADLRLPAHSIVPDHSKILGQKDVEALASSLQTEASISGRQMS